MLSIKLIGSSKQEVGYYSDLGEDYYVDGGEPPGQWWGQGAAELGLKGTVQAEAFRNILEGWSANGQSKLVQNAGRLDRRAAFDLTFSVPKSVSIARATADEKLAKQIDLACDAASRKAFEAVQELCGFTRRGGAGKHSEPGKLVAAVFRHETARGIKDNMPDPNLHYHMVLCNLAVRADGSTGTFDARVLFRRQMKMALGALFRTELSKGLEQIGLATHRPHNDRGRPVTWFELKAVPKKIVEAFSKRRSQIVEWLKTHGQSGAKAAERAALSTRQNKNHYSRNDLRNAWCALAERLGFCSNQLKQKSLTQFPPAAQEQVKLAVARALEQVIRERGHFTETDLLRYSAQEAQCQQVGAKQVISAVRETLTNENLILPLQVVNGERRYTTQEVLDMEKRLFKSAEDSVNNAQHVVANRILAAVIQKHETLKPEQAEAIRHITGRTGRIQCVNGMAGTGKTFMLGVANQAWRTAGLDVIGTALAAKAAQGLQEGSRIPSTHVHRLLWELKNGKRALSERSVLVVDEAGMIGTRMMEELVALTERTSSKLVLVGDHRQLQAIEFGAPFRGIAERIGVAELQEITRQRNRWAKEAVTELARGQADSALQKYANRGLLKIADDRDSAINQLVADWKTDYLKGTDTRILQARD